MRIIFELKKQKEEKNYVASVEWNHFFYYNCCTYIKNQTLGIVKGMPYTSSSYTSVPDAYNYFVAFIIK